MKILYVHYRPAKTEAQVKALADKVKLLKEVSPLAWCPAIFITIRLPFFDGHFRVAELQMVIL